MICVPAISRRLGHWRLHIPPTRAECEYFLVVAAVALTVACSSMDVSCGLVSKAPRAQPDSDKLHSVPVAPSQPGSPQAPVSLQPTFRCA